MIVTLFSTIGKSGAKTIYTTVNEALSLHGKNNRSLERASAKRKFKSSMKRKHAKQKVLKAERKLINEERTDERGGERSILLCQQNVGGMR